jgi:transcriptional regulator with XRE-family HTH domain
MNSEDLVREKFIAIRKQMGLSQAELAELLYCGQSNISKKEKGLRPIYAWEVAEFSQLSGVSIKEFFE